MMWFFLKPLQLLLARLTLGGEPRPADDDRLLSEDELIAMFAHTFAVAEVEVPAGGDARPSASPRLPAQSPFFPLVAAGPCRYASHRWSDWRSDSGRLICGQCHPPVRAMNHPVEKDERG